MSDTFDLPNTNDATLEDILDNTGNKHIYLSSDWHIMKYKYTKERNPVNTTEIVKWCKNNIKPNDVFIYLGDLAYRYANQHDSDEIKEIYKSLPGIKVLILGNHDIMQGEEFYKNCGFDYIFNEFLYKNILFTHRPVDMILRGYITGLNIHGHIHTLSNDYDFIHPDRNVNVYPANYNNKPVTLDYILNHINKLTKDNAPNGRTDGLTESAELIRNFLQDNINLLEAVNKDPEDRETVYLKTIKTIEKMGIKPKVSKESLNKFINCELNDFNNYDLCISIGKTGAEQKEVCAAVNKEIKNYGGKLTPDNYGTVFLSLNESSLLQEETKRSQIPDNEFGIPQERKYPLDTESHVRSAVKMFNYVEPKYEEQLAKAVIKKMKKFGIKDMKISKENRLYKYINESSLTDAKQCKYCGSNNIIKIETMFYGQQAYKCVDCNEILGTVPDSINEDYKIGELDYKKHNWWHLSDKPNDKSGIDEELFSKTIDYAVNNDCSSKYFEKSNSCRMYLYTCNGEDDLTLIPAGVINVYKAIDTGRLNWEWVEKYNLTIDDNGLIIKDPIHEATLLIRSLTEQLYDFTEETKMGEKLEKYDLKGTKTEQCLKAAFAGESEARNKYTYYAAKAKKDGYNQIGNIFTETANNEREHAKIWFKLLHDGDIPDTEENLKDAIEGEHYEWSEMYQKFAEVAREEGFDDIAKTFEMVGEIEKAHGMRYAKLLENIEDGIVFSRDGDKIWKCGNCGHIHIGKEAPEECPVCSHPQKFFELLSENY